MTKRSLKIMQLYPNDMNIYGDWGNVLVLKKRAERHGYEVQIINHNIGDKFTADVDIVVGGGGQDSGQKKVQADLQLIAPELHKMVNADTPMLLICGMYQLFGERFITKDGEVIPGIGIFKAETRGGNERLIGNITITSERFGEIIGYENHSGQTYLHKSTEPLGTVRLGAGNNLRDDNEGAILNNAIGTYLHGSLLPKNPRIADFLIKQAATKKYGDFTPAKIDDSLADEARKIAMSRPR